MNLFCNILKVLVIYTTFIFCQNNDTLKLPHLKVGDDAPDFTLVSIKGERFYLSDELKKNKPIVLNFFATWCGPCRTEIPEIDTLSKSFKDISFYLIDVNNLEKEGKKMKESKQLIYKFIEDVNVNLEILLDKLHYVFELYIISSSNLETKRLELPRTIVINKKGKIAYVKSGFQAGDENELKLELEKLVNDKR